MSWGLVNGNVKSAGQMVAVMKRTGLEVVQVEHFMGSDTLSNCWYAEEPVRNSPLHGMQ